MVSRCLFWLAVIATAQAQSLRIPAGEARSVRFDANVSIDAVRTEPPLPYPPVVRRDAAGQLRITVPPGTPPGNYRLLIGRAVLDLTVDAVTVPPSSKTPVILMNGWMLSCPSNPDSSVGASADTFGQLASLLQSDGIPLVFFNNCVYGQDVPIETLAAQFNGYIATLTYTDGTPVQQVDLIAHSMGGLIARAYLAGIQPDGSAVPPLAPKVRKFVELATPNFGSFQAQLFSSTQTSEMVPGSAFLWTLGTWNQRLDDLRGVDALAVIGNNGTAPQTNQSDGLVSLTSGSLEFARPDERTRIVPYCHVTPSGLIALFVPCRGQGIADIDSSAHLSARTVRSFLADTPDWKSIGTTPSQDQYLSQFGGVYFAAVQANGTLVTDVTQVSFGSTALSNGGAAGTVYYNEFLKDSGSFQASSTSLKTINCGPFTEPTGYYSVYRCKPQGPQIYSVGPFTAGTPARVVPSGRPVTVSGAGFGSPCGSCAVVFNPGNISLDITAWTDQSITATLPAYSGGVQLSVRTLAGSDTIAIMTSAPTSSISITSVSNAASSAPGPIAPGELVAIKGSGLGPANGVTYSLNSAGMVDPTLAGVRVFFGTIAAPILYASAGQVNVVVPYEIAGQSQTFVQVSYAGNLTPATTLAVASSAPSAFTSNYTGSGQALAFYPDYTFNTASNPAPKNTYLTIYFTGGGQTTPPGVTGGVNGLILKNLPKTTVTVGGVPASVQFSGAAPSLLDGISQLNIQLAPNTPSGAQLLVITLGGMSSPPAATIAVQ
jgi:uncharacterized protein (TIGR03437 family)